MASAAGAPSSSGQQPSSGRRPAGAALGLTPLHRLSAMRCKEAAAHSTAGTALMAPGALRLHCAALPLAVHPAAAASSACRRPSLMCRCCWPARRTWAPRTAPAPWSATCTAAATTASLCSTCRRRACALWGREGAGQVAMPAACLVCACTAWHAWHPTKPQCCWLETPLPSGAAGRTVERHHVGGSGGGAAAAAAAAQQQRRRGHGWRPDDATCAMELRAAVHLSRFGSRERQRRGSPLMLLLHQRPPANRSHPALTLLPSQLREAAAGCPHHRGD